MKKTNKKLAALSAIGLFSMSGITFVACDKDNTEPANDSRTEVVTEKSANANIYELVKDATLDICYKIDAAYIDNPELFRTICESEDIEAFMNLTGITESEIEAYEYIINTAYEIQLSENPEFDNELEDDNCIECTSNPLTKLYNITSEAQAQGGIGTIVSNLDDYDVAINTSSCVRLCKLIPIAAIRIFCLIGCAFI